MNGLLTGLALSLLTGSAFAGECIQFDVNPLVKSCTANIEGERLRYRHSNMAAFPDVSGSEFEDRIINQCLSHSGSLKNCVIGGSLISFKDSSIVVHGVDVSDMTFGDDKSNKLVDTFACERMGDNPISLRCSLKEVNQRHGFTWMITSIFIDTKGTQFEKSTIASMLDKCGDAAGCSSPFDDGTSVEVRPNNILFFGIEF